MSDKPMDRRRFFRRGLQELIKPLADAIAPLEQVANQLGSMEAIKELVKLGLGVSMIAPWICRAELAQKSLTWLPAPGGKLPRTWCIACQAGRKLSIAEQTFIGLCKEAAKGLADD